MKRLLLLAVLASASASPAGAADAASADPVRPGRLADAFLGAVRRGDEPSARTALAQIRSLLGDAAVPAAGAERLEPVFAWSAFQTADTPELARIRFSAGERLAGDGMFVTRAESAGGLQIALTGVALVAVRRAGEPATAIRHDFAKDPILTVPVAAGDEIAVLPLAAPAGLPSLGVSAFDPYFPCTWAALEGERLDGAPGRVRAALIHFETDRESSIVRFELQRSARPDGGWRTIAAVPATGGGDYHLVDTRSIAPAHYRVVPVLVSGMRGAPSMIVVLGP